MGGLTTLVRSVAEILGRVLPPWVILTLVGIATVMVLPFYLKGQRRSLARRRISAMHGLSQPEAGRLEAEAFSLVGRDPDGLVVVAEEALRRGREAVARRALERLSASGRRPTEVVRLQRILEGPGPRLPEEEALAIDRLLQSDLTQAARQRLDRARTRWPDLPEWDDLATRLGPPDAAPPADGEPTRGRPSEEV